MVHIPLTKQEILTALGKALSQNFIDNLRNRHPNVALDSKLRGYVGELAFQKWASSFGVEFKQSNIKDYSSGMDIDFVFKKGNTELQLELKTSLIPDVDQDLIELQKRRDIKLIRRNGKSIEQLDGDIHIQIIFKQLRLRKDDWLKKQEIEISSFSDSSAPIEDRETDKKHQNKLEVIYTQLAAFRYETDTYLMGWIDKETLIKQIHSKKDHLKIWKYGMREFWTCNLEKEAEEPLTLIDYLKA